MADARPFLLQDATGAPLTGVACVVLAYDRSGNARTVGVTELGDGMYSLNPSDADEAIGTVAFVSCYPAVPQYITFALFKADRSNQFWAFHVEDPSGGLWNSTSPTIGSYRSSTGVSLIGSAPALVGFSGSFGLNALFCCTPSASDIAADVEVRFDGPAGSAQPYWYGSVEPIAASAPSVSATAQPTSTYQAAQLGAAQAVLWEDYQEELAPPWLRAGSGKGWLRALGNQKDLAELRVKDAVKARFPLQAPVDALGNLANERQLAQGTTESQSAFRARLRAAWDVWPWAGTPTGLLRALYYAGYPNTALITAQGNAHQLDANLNVVTTAVPGGYSFTSGFWNGFKVLFFPSWPASWAGTPPGNTSDEVNFIRSLVNQWKPGHGLLEDMQVVGLPVWGWPTTQAWGTGTWGNAIVNTVWTPS